VLIVDVRVFLIRKSVLGAYDEFDRAGAVIGKQE